LVGKNLPIKKHLGSNKIMAKELKYEVKVSCKGKAHYKTILAYSGEQAKFKATIGMKNAKAEILSRKE